LGQGVSVNPVKAALAMNYGDAGMSSPQVAEIVGIPARTVRDIVSRHGHWGEMAERPVFAQLRLEQKQHLEAASRYLSSQCLIHVEENLHKCSSYQAAGIYGLLRTHERLDAGEATTNVAVHAEVEVRGLDQLAAALSEAILERKESNNVPASTTNHKSST